MGRKKGEAVNGEPPGVGGAGYRKRAGKIGITVSATPEERDRIRVAAAQAGLSMSAYLLARGLKDTSGRPRRPKPETEDRSGG
jgi:hypothetical protein